MATFSRKVRFLIKKSNLSEAEKRILETPPEIVKMTIDYLVSFSDKPRKNPPSPWIIFLKNFGEYLRKTFPGENFRVQAISRRASSVWRALEDTDIIKIYFGILAKMTEENRKMRAQLIHSTQHLISHQRSNNIVNINIGANDDTGNESAADEFVRDFFSGTSLNTNTMSSRQEDDYEEPPSGNEIIHQYYSGGFYPFSNGL